jgi:pentatricopeptide repeat protein
MVLDLYERMRGEGIEPDRVIFLCVLKACGRLGALCRGQTIDDLLRRRSIDVGVVLGTALIEMYVDCGHLSDAHSVMASLPSRSNVAWNAMIAGYAAHGDSGMVERCIDGMRKEGLKLDRMGYIQILAACTHSGSLEHGRSLFDSLVGGYGDMLPSIEHYSCMVDLLGRAGSLGTAESLVETMPLPPDIIVWRSLLSSCQCHRNAEIGSRCFDELSKKLDAGQ